MLGICAVSAAGMSMAGETARPDYRRLVAATMIGNLLEWYGSCIGFVVLIVSARARPDHFI